MLRFLTQIGSVIAFAKRHGDTANGFCGPDIEMDTSLHNHVSTTEQNRHHEKDAASLERQAAVESLKERCRTERGIEISGQDLRRVVGCQEASALYKWLNHGSRNKRFRAAIDLPTSQFVEEALRLRPKEVRRSQTGTQTVAKFARS